MTNHILIVLCCISSFISCSENTREKKKIDLPSGYSQIQNIISIADCKSQFGPYTTEVHSSQDGSSHFIQTFSDTIPPFVVKINTENVGFMINAEDSITDTLSQEDVEMIRGHEFHKLSIDPFFFFSHIVYKKSIEVDGLLHDLYMGKDGLNNPVSIYYDKQNRIIPKIELLNSKDTSQTIEIVYMDWIPSRYGPLAKEVDIIQDQKDTFNFDFKSIKITDKDGSIAVFD